MIWFSYQYKNTTWNIYLLIYMTLVLIRSPLNLMSFSIDFGSVGSGCKFKISCASVKEMLYYISNNVYHWWYELSFWLQKEALQGVANSSSNKESDHKRPEWLNINYNCALIYNCCLTKCSLRNLSKISHPYSLLKGKGTQWQSIAFYLWTIKNIQIIFFL